MRASPSKWFKREPEIRVALNLRSTEPCDQSLLCTGDRDHAARSHTHFRQGIIIRVTTMGSFGGRKRKSAGIWLQLLLSALVIGTKVTPADIESYKACRSELSRKGQNGAKSLSPAVFPRGEQAKQGNTGGFSSSRLCSVFNGLPNLWR